MDGCDTADFTCGGQISAWSEVREKKKQVLELKGRGARVASKSFVIDVSGII